MSEDVIKIDSDQFPCPGCGAFMVFSPKTQGLNCEYCGTEIDITKDEHVEEHDFDAFNETATHEWLDENRVIKCESCGGESIISTHEITAECVFCGSAHVVVEEMKEGIPPESLIPFMMTRTGAKENINTWLSGKFYAPKALSELKKLDTLRSVYIPYFTYDSKTSTFYIAQRGDHYTVTVTKIVDGKTKHVQEQRTRWTTVEGVHKRAFDDILVHASKKVEEKLIQEMKSFDLTKLEGYQKAYLLGHHAERYSISLLDGWEDAKKRMYNSIYSGIRTQVGGDEFRLAHYQTNYANKTYKHILLPIWITNYTYKKKSYHVYINGQTGRVVGEYPKSVLKIMMTILVFVALSLLIYYIITRS